jgi:hypothetical protein
MILKFNQYLKENVLDNEEETRKWEVKVNGESYSFNEYKHDAIDDILEILNNEGETNLDDYEDNDGTEYYHTSEILNMLDDLNETDFYKKLNDLKTYVSYHKDIKLINLDDDNELEFLEK